MIDGCVKGAFPPDPDRYYPEGHNKPLCACGHDHIGVTIGRPRHESCAEGCGMARNGARTDWLPCPCLHFVPAGLTIPTLPDRVPQGRTA